MARKKGKSNPEQTVIDYRHEDAKRKNIPPAGLAAKGKIREKPAVNNWGQLGRWAFHVCKDPQMLGRELEWLKQQTAVR